VVGERLSLNILVQSFKKNKVLVFAIVAITIIVNIMNGVAIPELFSNLVASLFQGNDNSLVLCIIALASLLVFIALLTMINKLLSFNVQRDATFYIEDELISHYTRLDYWEEKMLASDTLAIIRQVAPTAAENTVNIYISLIGKGALLVASSIYMILISPLVLVVTFMLTGIIMLVMKRGVKKLPELQSNLNERVNDLHSKLWEQINNNEVSGFLNPQRVPRSYLRTSEDCMNDLKEIKIIGNRTSFAQKFGSLFMIIVAAGLGGILSIWGIVTMESVYAMVLVIPMIASVLLGIPNSLADLKTLSGNYKTIDSFLIINEYEASNKLIIDRTIKSLQINSLSYKYPGNKEATIADISFKLEADSKVTYLVGPSGCGKSTLMKILARVLPYCDGKVVYEDIELNNCERESFYKHVCYIDQTPHVLPGTIRWNILMGEKEDTSLLQAAINDAQLSELINKVGLDATVSKDTMSNGELQKICFARAFYRQFDVLLMDEATAALDPNAEKSIIEALERRISLEKKIVIAITHRHTCIAEANRVFMIKNGKINFDGSHQGLLDVYVEFSYAERL